jgi:hypothetical protein
MPLCRALPFALVLFAAGVAEIQAQGAPAQGQMPPCIQNFMPLRQDVEKRFAAAQKAVDRRASATELCGMFTQISEAETKMIKYVEDQGMWCGFPPDALPGMKASHTRTLGYRKQACDAAAAGVPARPPGPSLSDALGSPVPDASTTKTGRGTFDTLTGNPLAR